MEGRTLVLQLAVVRDWGSILHMKRVFSALTPDHPMFAGLGRSAASHRHPG